MIALVQYLRLLDLKAFQSANFSCVDFVHVDVSVLLQLVLPYAGGEVKVKFQTHSTALASNPTCLEMSVCMRILRLFVHSSEL